MKPLLFCLILFVGCGKVKHEVTQPAPLEALPLEVKPVEIRHGFYMDVSIFRTECERRFKTVTDEYEKEELVNDCIDVQVESFLRLLDAFKKGNQND